MFLSCYRNPVLCRTKVIDIRSLTYTVSQKTVACLIHYNLKKLEPIVINLAFDGPSFYPVSQNQETIYWCPQTSEDI